MDFDSIGDRLKEIQISKSDNIEYTKESMEENVPKILSPEIQDVFHVFASMLDIKSFMKLALTSKDMYTRCMDDNRIRISVDVRLLDIWNEMGNSYIAAIQKLPCKINVRTLPLSRSPKPGAPNVHRYMKEIGVNKIHELNVRDRVTDWETIMAIDFCVDTLNVTKQTIENDILRSILQLNLEKFCYSGLVPVDFILQIDTSIREIYFPGVRNISKEALMDIFTLIQSGSIPCLSVIRAVIKLNDFNKLPFDYQGQLPDDRPLVLARTPRNYHALHEYWFLHWHGGVTKCVTNGSYILKMYKCEPWEYPWILRREEDVLKDLAERRPSVLCSAEQFRAFYKSLSVLDYFHKGPLPDDRPLSFRESVWRFWMLDDGDNLMSCSWEGGYATWKPFCPSQNEHFEHPALAKFVFWKILEQVEGNMVFNLTCNEFHNSWFEGVKQLDFDFSDVLPNERPLVFEKIPVEERRRRFQVILLDDRLLQCYFVNGRQRFCVIRICPYLDRPRILFTAKNVVEMLKGPVDDDVQLPVHFEVFRDGVEMLKKSILVLQNRLVIVEKATTKIWYNVAKDVRKAVWKDGCLSVSKADLCESPPSFMKQAFRYFAGREGTYGASVKMDLKQFHSCLEEFTVVPFDYSGPLPRDSPVAFVKNKLSHTCRKEETSCQCSGVYSVFVYFLWADGLRVTNCSWDKYEWMNVRFNIYFIRMPDKPSFLKSNEYLQRLLQAKYDKSSRFEWFGLFDDFLTHVEDYMKLPFDHNDPLPEERPILFESKPDMEKPACFFVLREDGTIIKCACHMYSASLSLSSRCDDDVPPSLKNLP